MPRVPHACRHVSDVCYCLLAPAVAGVAVHACYCLHPLCCARSRGVGTRNRIRIALGRLVGRVAAATTRARPCRPPRRSRPSHPRPPAPPRPPHVNSSIRVHNHVIGLLLRTSTTTSTIVQMCWTTSDVFMADPWVAAAGGPNKRKFLTTQFLIRG